MKPAAIQKTSWPRPPGVRLTKDGKWQRLMISLVSPEYSFEEFCLRMVGKDLVFEVTDAASAEITYARQIHRMDRFQLTQPRISFMP
jgi:hypothetical protein